MSLEMTGSSNLFCQIRSLLWTVVVIIGWLCAFSFGGSSAAPFRIVVTEPVTPLVPNSVMDLAQRLGYFTREGLAVQIVRVPQTPVAVTALMTRDGDMANISVEALLHLAMAKSVGVKAVMSPNKSIAYLLVANQSIRSLSQLKGKRYGIGRIGSLDHSLGSEVLRANGVDPNQLHLLAVGHPEARAQALAAGHIDATAISVGTWTVFGKQKGIHVLLPMEDFFRAAPLISKVNVVRQDVLVERRAEVIAVVTALTKASRVLANDPTQWMQAMSDARRDVGAADLRELTTYFRGSWSVNGGLNRRELEFTQNWLHRGPDFARKEKVPLQRWVDFSVADEVLAKIGIDPESDEPTR
jgi:NitT/TauT family transport system substrate-binding protein